MNGSIIVRYLVHFNSIVTQYRTCLLINALFAIFTKGLFFEFYQK